MRSRLPIGRILAALMSAGLVLLTGCVWFMSDAPLSTQYADSPTAGPVTPAPATPEPQNPVYLFLSGYHEAFNAAAKGIASASASDRTAASMALSLMGCNARLASVSGSAGMPYDISSDGWTVGLAEGSGSVEPVDGGWEFLFTFASGRVLSGRLCGSVLTCTLAETGSTLWQAELVRFGTVYTLLMYDGEYSAAEVSSGIRFVCGMVELPADYDVQMGITGLFGTAEVCLTYIDGDAEVVAVSAPQ